MPTALSTNVSKNAKVIIVPVVEHFDEYADICAINWFDLKTPWMYKLYGLIASRYVRKVSGKLIFKGTLSRKLIGPKDRLRDNLLIVRYPGPRKFLQLVNFKIFQIVSVLRLAAVKRFVFGFTENILGKTESADAGERGFNLQQIYLVHHFQGNNNWLRMNHGELFDVARQYQLDVYFCGLTCAHIAREKSGQRQDAEFFMDGMVLFAANSEVDTEKFIKDDLYRTFIENNNDNSLYLFTRTH